jgi:hypothetical protein
MRRGKEYGRSNGKTQLSDAISRIFSERASFELRDDEVEALRKQLKNGNLSHVSEETAKWKVSLHHTNSWDVPQMLIHKLVGSAAYFWKMR